MGKLGEVKGNVSLTIDKLAEIGGDLTRNDDNWLNCEALRSWTRRNPLDSHGLDDEFKEQVIIPSIKSFYNFFLYINSPLEDLLKCHIQNWLEISVFGQI